MENSYIYCPFTDLLIKHTRSALVLIKRYVWQFTRLLINSQAMKCSHDLFTKDFSVVYFKGSVSICNAPNPDRLVKAVFGQQKVAAQLYDVAFIRSFAVVLDVKN